MEQVKRPPDIKSSIDELLDRLAESLKNLPADRMKELEDLLIGLEDLEEFLNEEESLDE